MIGSLVSIRLRSLLASMRGKNKDGTTGGVGRIVLLLFAYTYIGAVFLFMFFGAAISLAPLMIEAGLDSLYFALFMLIAFSMIFFFSVFETKAHLFECRDNELLGAMPIKPGDIVISRIIVVLILNYIEAALVFLPAITVYALCGGSTLGIIGACLVFILLPPLATSLSSAVGYAVAYISKKFKNNSFIPLVISLLFLGLYFYAYSAILSVPESELGEVISSVALSLLPIGVIGLAAMLHPIATPLFAVVCIGASFVAYKAIARGYSGIASATDGAKKKEYKAVSSRESTSFTALAKKELLRFISSSTYMLNGGLGAIMSIVLAVVAVFQGEELVTGLGMISAEMGVTLDYGTLIPAVMSAAIVLISSTVTISASSVSLEGKSFWILKSMPVSARTVVLAKTVPHIAVGATGGLISALVLAIGFKMAPLCAVLTVLAALFSNFFVSLLGVTMNILLPKLEYENEVQPIKQSAAVGLTMLISMVVGFMCLAFSFMLGLVGLGTLAQILIVIVLAILTAVFFVIALIPMSRRLEALSA